MFNSKLKRIILPLLVAVSILVIILSVKLIQREFRWKETRREMDMMEDEILKKIVITENERLPLEMMDALYTAIMTTDAEVDSKYLPEFEALTEEFLKRINSQMKLLLNPEDLHSSVANKSDFEEYGDEIILVSYEFDIEDQKYSYVFKKSEVSKAIVMGTIRVNRVIIGNENNEYFYPIYSEWKSKFDAYSGKMLFMEDYNKFMNRQFTSIFPKEGLITFKNISKYIRLSR